MPVSFCWLRYNKRFLHKLLLKVKMLHNASYFGSKCDLLEQKRVPKLVRNKLLCDKHLHIAHIPEKWVDACFLKSGYRLGPEGSRVKKFNLIVFLSDQVKLQTFGVFDYRNDIIFYFWGTTRSWTIWLLSSSRLLHC